LNSSIQSRIDQYFSSNSIAQKPPASPSPYRINGSMILQNSNSEVNLAQIPSNPLTSQKIEKRPSRIKEDPSRIEEDFSSSDSEIDLPKENFKPNRKPLMGQSKSSAIIKRQKLGDRQASKIDHISSDKVNEVQSVMSMYLR
jgi:hypothetical protein